MWYPAAKRQEAHPMTTETTLVAARRCAREGRYREAAVLFAAHLEERSPEDSLQERIELGFALLLAGDGAGARSIYDALVAVVARVGSLPARAADLWERFASLVAGARRQVVLAGVASAVVLSSGCGGSAAPAAAPSSGDRPVAEAPAASGERPAPVVGNAPVVPSSIPAPTSVAVPTAGSVPDRVFSAHRYSGGVALNLKLDELVAETAAAAATAAATVVPTATTVPVPTFTLPPTVKPGFSAHRYSGGVALDLHLDREDAGTDE
jgi:hypothetical protein